MRLINEMRSVIIQTIEKIPIDRIPIGDITERDLPLSLKDVVYSRAYFSTIITQLTTEVADSFPITDSHIESIILCCLLWTFLTVINRKNATIVSRLGDLIEVTTVKRNASRILFVLYIMFCKNVDNAI